MLQPSTEAEVWKEPESDPLSDLGESPREAGGNLDSSWAEMLAVTISGSSLCRQDTTAGKLHLADEHHELIYPSVGWPSPGTPWVLQPATWGQSPAHQQAGINPEHSYAVQQAMQGPGFNHQWARSHHMEQGLAAKLARGQPSASEHSIVVGPATREAGGGPPGWHPQRV